MIDELVENIEAYLRLNKIGDMSDKLTLDYIEMSLDIYKKSQKKSDKSENRETVRSV
jgi:hypothetical protein